MNAEKVPNVRQSRLVAGLKKLNANSRNTRMLRIATPQSPYAGTPE